MISRATHGTVVLMGSGEMTPGMAAVHRYAMSLVPSPVRAAFLNTPAGFQLNADLIASKAVEYFQRRLNSELIPIDFKSAQSVSAAETQAAVRILHRSNYVFAGPGSPTYAINHWRGTPVFDAILEALARGGCLVLASAAALTTGRFTIPVYEIYKVGEDPHWFEGLDVLGQAALDVCVVPHWNNTSGGDHDTRFCFMGEPRWAAMGPLLPASTAILGIDENTACFLRFDEDIAEVRGKGTVTVQRGGESRIFTTNSSFSLDLLRPEQRTKSGVPTVAPASQGGTAWEALWRRREALLRDSTPGVGEIRAYLYDLIDLMSTARKQQDWQAAEQVESSLREALVVLTARLDSAPAEVDTRAVSAPYVDLLVSLRETMRADRQWPLADRLRDDLAALGVAIADNPAGSSWRWMDEGN